MRRRLKAIAPPDVRSHFQCRITSVSRSRSFTLWNERRSCFKFVRKSSKKESKDELASSRTGRNECHSYIELEVPTGASSYVEMMIVLPVPIITPDLFTSMP